MKIRVYDEETEALVECYTIKYDFFARSIYMKNIKNVILLIVCFLFLSGCNQVNEDEVQKYIKEKHEIDVVVTHLSPLNANNMGHTYHTVQAKNNKNIQFRVEIDGFFNS